jgi:sulfoquinovose isomerase
MGWLDSAAHHRWLEAEGDRLLRFGRAARDPAGGFGWLDSTGRPDPGRPQQLWVNARMTHVYALAYLMGRPGAGALADHGIAALRGRFHDDRHGGWYAQVTGEGPTQTDKTAYEHAFVVLAGASATAAGRPGAAGLLDQAVTVLRERFWDDEHGMVVEQWDESFSELDGYRGVNANMHTVEALLTAADVLAEPALRGMALRIVTRVVHDLAAGNDWRIPEHFDASWTPDLDYNRDEPAHPFRPFGATVGHSLEWARLLLQLRAALGGEAPAWLLPDARSLFEAAVRDGWAVDGTDGFVYTVDWAGAPVVRERMHWVAAEATATAAALHRVTGEAGYAGWYETWWDHIGEHFIDRDGGSWWHELSPESRPSAEVWDGKPDIYHAFQATLVPRLPLAPTLAVALRDGQLS